MQTSTPGRRSTVPPSLTDLVHGGTRLAGFEARAPRKKSLETGRIYTRYGPLWKRTCSIGDTLQAPSVLNHRQTPQGCRLNSLGVTSTGFIAGAKEVGRREKDRREPLVFDRSTVEISTLVRDNDSNG